MTGALDRIQHIVVVMLENRSFDNLLGFLYAGDNNRPPRNLPMQSSPTFAGFTTVTGSDLFWNPANPEFFSQGAAPDKVFASAGTIGPAPFKVRKPDCFAGLHFFPSFQFSRCSLKTFLKSSISSLLVGPFCFSTLPSRPFDHRWR